MASSPRYRRLKTTVTHPPRKERTAAERGYDWQWFKVAKLARERDCQMCQDCIDEGGVVLATQTLVEATEAHPVDHIIPAHVRPDLFYDLDNLRTRCPRHHAAKTQEDLKRYGAARR